MAPNLILSRWATELPFLPTSSQQVLRYLSIRGLPIPKTREGSPTTGEKDLELLLDKLEREGGADPALHLILNARKLKKGIGYLYDTYLGKDGRMHPEWTLLPETGRLSSRRPNMQNQPQGRHSEIANKLAQAVRSTVIPTPGYSLIELDWKSMEAILLSWFANDPEYARISRLGAHAYLMSHYLGRPADLSWTDDKLGRFLDELKEDPANKGAYHTCKTANLADTYDVGLIKLAKVLNCSKADAQKMKDLRKRAFPKISEWQMSTRMRAHFEGKLVNPFGYINYFWNVFEKKKVPTRDGKTWGLGGQAHECLAFLPQSSNAAMCRQVVLEFLRMRLDWVYLLAPIHDALLVEAREGEERRAVEMLTKLMVREWPQLGGLSIAVDVKWGKNWAEMKKWS